MGKSSKGSAFEREICKKLSLWWTHKERDDIFWRTAGSGARATVRGRKGKSTAGHYGDIMAVDSIGADLIKVLTFELKCGYTRFTFMDLLDKLDHAALQEYEKWIMQAMESQRQAGSLFWAVIHRRTRRKTLLYAPISLFKSLNSVCCNLYPVLQMTCWINGEKILVGGITLDEFLDKVTPEGIRDMPLPESAGKQRVFKPVN